MVFWYDLSSGFLKVGGTKSSKVMKEKGTPPKGTGNPPATNLVTIYGFNVERFNSFTGRILTLAETLGLPEPQQTAFKTLLKQEVWDLWEHPAFIEEKDYQSGIGRVV